MNLLLTTRINVDHNMNLFLKCKCKLSGRVYAIYKIVFHWKSDMQHNPWKSSFALSLTYNTMFIKVYNTQIENEALRLTAYDMKFILHFIIITY